MPSTNARCSAYGSRRPCRWPVRGRPRGEDGPSSLAIPDMFTRLWAWPSPVSRVRYVFIKVVTRSVGAGVGAHGSSEVDNYGSPASRSSARAHTWRCRFRCSGVVVDRDHRFGGVGARLRDPARRFRWKAGPLVPLVGRTTPDGPECDDVAPGPVGVGRRGGGGVPRSRGGGREAGPGPLPFSRRSALSIRGAGSSWCAGGPGPLHRPRPSRFVGPGTPGFLSRRARNAGPVGSSDSGVPASSSTPETPMGT